ncbi:MAG: OmpA family protein [Massilia sp.]
MTLSRLIYKIFLRSVGRSRKQLDIAIIEKERALTVKALSEASAVRMEKLRKNGAAFGFGYGLLVVFCYCFFDLKFFPSGLSTGDVLFFLFAALGLGLMSMFCTAVGTTLFLPAVFYEACLPLAPASAAKPHDKMGDMLWYISPATIVLTSWIVSLWSANWYLGRTTVYCIAVVLDLALFLAIARIGLKRNRASGGNLGWDDAIVHGVGFAFLAPLICAVLIPLKAAGWYLLMALGFAGLAAALAISLLDMRVMMATTSTADERQRRARRVTTVLVLLGFAMIPSVVSPIVRQAVFSQMGVRTEDTAISMDKPNLALIQSAADAAGIALSVCRGEDGSAIVGPVNVLWHATGSRSLVQLKGNAGVDLELNAAGLKLVRGPVERCVEIKEALLFASATATVIGDSQKITNALEAELAPLIEELQGKWIIKSVKVIGHADPMPLPDQGNIILAKQRADEVKRMLIASPSLKKIAGFPEPESSSVGSRNPIKQCDTKETAAYQRDCNEVNRRVEVRFRLEPKPPEKTTGAGTAAPAAPATIAAPVKAAESR